jgi:hypothetical protein
VRQGAAGGQCVPRNDDGPHAAAHHTVELAIRQRSAYRDGFGWANVDTSAAIAAGLRVDDGVIVFHRDSVQRAGFNALTTTRTRF